MSSLRIDHRTTFRYGHEVGSSYNEARLAPAWLPRQRVIDSKLTVTPMSWSTHYHDYWDCDVLVFEVVEPHDSLTVVSSSLVEVTPIPHREERADWDAISGPRLQDLMCEYLVNTEVTEPSEELADKAAELAAGKSPDDAARAICDYVHDEVKYVPGATTVHSPAGEAWEARSGVCQDMAQIAIGAMRSVGIPARYVSGYLHPKPDAGIGETVHGESHAWVEWWAGDWRGFDPTNAREVGDHHVIVGRAREYKDIPPMRGVVAGETTELEVVVKVTQEA